MRSSSECLPSDLARMPSVRALGNITDTVSIFSRHGHGLGDIGDVLSSIESSVSGSLSTDTSPGTGEGEMAPIDAVAEAAASPDSAAYTPSIPSIDTSGGRAPAPAPLPIGPVAGAAAPAPTFTAPRATAPVTAVGQAAGAAGGGLLSGIGDVLKGLAIGASSVPAIAATFGQNKQVTEQQKLQEEALEAQTVLAVSQARQSAASSASLADAIKTAAPYVGGALVLAAIGYGVSRALSGRRR